MNENLLCNKPFGYIWNRTTQSKSVNIGDLKPDYIGWRLFNNSNVYYHVRKLYNGYRKWYYKCQELSAEIARLKAELENAGRSNNIKLQTKVQRLEGRLKKVDKDYNAKAWRKKPSKVGCSSSTYAQIMSEVIEGKSLEEILKTSYSRSKRGRIKRYKQDTILKIIKHRFELYEKYPEEFNSRGISLEMLQTWDYKGWRKNNKS